MKTSSFTLQHFRSAQRRINNYVRKTPLVKASLLKVEITHGANLLLKLENQQPTGSFKVRGASNAMMMIPKAAKPTGLVTASGGNHGLGVAYAAAMGNLPNNTPDEKVSKLKLWKAEVNFSGSVWDEAHIAAKKRAEKDGLTYIHPFANHNVIHGQGTIGLEILDEAPHVDLILVAIGGGGLISGVAAASKLIKPELKLIGVEPIGAPTLFKSRRNGSLHTLANVSTRAGTLAPKRSEEINFDLIEKYVDEIVLVSDEAMEKAAKWLWFEFGVAAELSGAAAVAALQTRAVTIPKGSTACAIVCGAGIDGLNLL